MATLLKVSELIGGGYGSGWFTNCKDRYRVFSSARNTKKSVDIMGFEPILKILSNQYRNVLFVRQNEVDNGSSTFPNLIQRLDQMQLLPYFQIRNTPREIIYKVTGQQILFKGFNNPTGQTSLKARHGVFTDVYFEESSELKSYEDFRKVDGSIRLGKKEAEEYGLTEKDLQLTLCMNPWNKEHWIYSTFFKGRLEDDPERMEREPFIDFEDPEFNLGFGKGLYLHKANYKINEFRSPEYDDGMMALKRQAPEIYLVEGLGCWGNSTEATYPELTDDLKLPRQEANRLRLSAMAIGIDFGISDGEGHTLKGKRQAEGYGSATTMQLCGLTADGCTLVCLDEYFWSNDGSLKPKTGPELQQELISTLKRWRDVDHAEQIGGFILPVYVDSADSGGFRQGLELEARRQGLFSVRFMPSTKIPIQSRVDFSRLLMAWGEFKVSEACPNLWREMKNARRGDDGRVRADWDDHATNANEYAWAPLRERIRRWKTFKSH